MQNILQFYKDLMADNRPWFKSVIWWFLLTSGIGIVTYFLKPDLLEIILRSFTERFGENPALDINLALDIFTQNVMVAAIALFGGLILGIIPILIVGVNGFILGFILVSIFSVLESDLLTSLSIILGGIVPHGILELPAFLVAAAIGLRLGMQWLSKEAEGSRLQVLKNNFKKSFLVFPSIALVLVIAALIEVFVSGKIVDNF